MTPDTPVTTPATTIAREAHTAAAANHAQALTNHHAASANAADALLAKQKLIERAADGALVGVTDLRAADEVVRDAEAAASLTGAIEASAHRKKDEAEIVLLREQAAARRRGWYEAVRRSVSAAHAVDEAVTAAQAALGAMERTLRQQAEAHRQAMGHDERVRLRRGDNAILAGTEPSEQPLAGGGLMMSAPLKVEIGISEQVWGERMPFGKTLAAHTLSQFGSTLPPVELAEVLAEIAPANKAA
jgi:hypothetical protein